MYLYGLIIPNRWAAKVVGKVDMARWFECYGITSVHIEYLIIFPFMLSSKKDTSGYTWLTGRRSPRCGSRQVLLFISYMYIFMDVYYLSIYLSKYVCMEMTIRAFLRHVERCHMILHIVSGDSADPIGDFKAVNAELQNYSPLLANKPQVVVLNKLDIPEVRLNFPHVFLQFLSDEEMFSLM